MTKNPLISVIVPCYNPPIEYFKEAVSSVLAQNYENWEVIIVNDGSDFEKIARIKEFIDSLNDSRISIINLSKNKGVAEAKNTGLSIARGDIITFLDTDDMHFPWYYKEIVECFSNNPVYLIYATPSFYFIRNHKKKEIYLSTYEYNLIEKPLETLFKNFKFNHLLTKEEEEGMKKVAKKTSLKLFINSTPRYAFKKEVFKDIKFDSNFLTSEDADLSMQILNSNELLSKTIVTTFPCYLYRIYSSQTRLTQNPLLVFEHMIKLNDKYSSTDSTAYKILNYIKRSEEWKLKKPLTHCLKGGTIFNYIKQFAFNSGPRKEAIKGLVSLITLFIKYKIIVQTFRQDIRKFKVAKTENINITNDIRERFNKYLNDHSNDRVQSYAKNIYKELF